MANKITEKYFSQGDFSQRQPEVLKEVAAETGFRVEKEIFRGVIYDSTKVGSLIYRGSFQGKAAVLKLQGLKPEIDEAVMLKEFAAQNRSKIVRAPALYLARAWSEERGYGYLITEYIGAPKIFTMPFADAGEQQEFIRFYQEYRSQAITRPWFPPEETDSAKFVSRRAANWRKISESKGRLKQSDYLPYLADFDRLAGPALADLPMVFSHCHITANDIHRLPDGSFVLMSNLFWGWRPEWYDLAFNIWACIEWIRDTNYTFEQLLNYVNQWLEVYRETPIVKKDKDFERKITLMLLERMIGGILVDVGVNEAFDKKENQPYFEHLLNLHQKFFNYLAEKLEKHD